jgi:hypothetical protein
MNQKLGAQAKWRLPRKEPPPRSRANAVGNQLSAVGKQKKAGLKF